MLWGVRNATLTIIIHATGSASVTSWESQGQGHGKRSPGGTGDSRVTQIWVSQRGVVMWLYVSVTAHEIVPPRAQLNTSI